MRSAGISKWLALHKQAAADRIICGDRDERWREDCATGRG